MKRVAELGEAADLLRAMGGHRAPIVVGVVGEDPDRLPADARESSDLAAAVARGHLEERVPVDHERDQSPHLVGSPTVARNDRQQLLLFAAGKVA